jgi:hypothetical protein
MATGLSVVTNAALLGIVAHTSGSKYGPFADDDAGERWVTTAGPR